MSSNDTISKTFVVAGSLCIVCSILVSVMAVSLKPTQLKNKDLDKKKNILMAAGLYENPETIDEVFNQKIKGRVVDLATGDYINTLDANTVDTKEAAKNPATSDLIPAGKDLGGIKRRAKHTVIYEVIENGAIEQVVLPVYGKGLWSTLYGFLAVKADGNTIIGLGFYEHAETPGLGGEVDNPRWKALWKGKKIYDENWNLKVEVLKGQVLPNSPNLDYQVDGLSGATITARGVGNLLRYWMGDEGFSKYLTKLRQGGLENG